MITYLRAVLSTGCGGHHWEDVEELSGFEVEANPGKMSDRWVVRREVRQRCQHGGCSAERTVARESEVSHRKPINDALRALSDGRAEHYDHGPDHPERGTCPTCSRRHLSRCHNCRPSPAPEPDDDDDDGGKRYGGHI